MPVYCYKCKDCSKHFEARHSMSYEEQICVFCNSENVFKVPKFGGNRSNAQQSSPKKTGKVVDEFIRDTKKDIEFEKQKLKNQEL